ncbi:biotin/lipoyl-containing protein [Fluviicola sp.]|uniref:acetyl-CoA carboxylase biotin carboxyl carrier protein subunit n=1 Tax=Fluviicola sp. TaxID=1917219 RepID=UPI00281CDD54|nr:biotin/lipoyl-containing protein [Fluviicola sp.]MDR0802117.1 acetyl-CoA carboxylase biotin carboxyl carrier protein subunit [Fluviicola sp.]
MANWTSDGEILHANRDGVHIHWENQQFFTITYKGKKFRGEVMSNRMEEGLLTLKLNHRIFEIKKRGPLDELIASLGMDKPKLRKLKQLKAPMPGRVISVAVIVGQAIEVGDPLLTLEAMKMENILKAEGTGVVKVIAVNPQDVVDKGGLLIEFE